VLWRYKGVSTLGTGSLNADAECEETLDVARALSRGWNLDIALEKELSLQEQVWRSLHCRILKESQIADSNGNLCSGFHNRLTLLMDCC
jgi:hypothetical protein